MKRFRQISVDCGRAHPEAEEQLTQHRMNSWLLVSLQRGMMAVPGTPHTPHACRGRQGSAGLPGPLFARARETGLAPTEPRSGRVGSKSIFLDYGSVVTKLGLPKDCRIRWVLSLLSFLSLDSEGSERVTRGCRADGVPLPGPPCPPLWASSPFMC